MSAPSPQSIQETDPETVQTTGNSKGYTDDVIVRSFTQHDTDACEAVFYDCLKQRWLSDFDDSVPMFLNSACFMTIVALNMFSFWVFKNSLILLSAAALVYHIYRCYLTEKDLEEFWKSEFSNAAREYLEKPLCNMWVAETEGKVVGMAALSHTEQHKEREAEITHLGVLRAYQGRAIDKRVLTELVKFAVEKDFQKVFVFTSCNAEMEIFADCGFDINGEVTRFSRFGEYFNDFRVFKMEMDL